VGGEVIGKVNGRKGMVVWNRSYGTGRMELTVCGSSYWDDGRTGMVVLWEWSRENGRMGMVACELLCENGRMGMVA
jgi:hypothetical protein